MKKQLIRIQLDVVVVLDAKYTPAEVKRMVRRNANIFPNNKGYTNSLRYTHENAACWIEDIYPKAEPEVTTLEQLEIIWGTKL